MYVRFTKAETGIYQVNAIREDCAYPLSGQVVIGLPVNLTALEGLTPLCANETATLTLAGQKLLRNINCGVRTGILCFRGL